MISDHLCAEESSEAGDKPLSVNSLAKVFRHPSQKTGGCERGKKLQYPPRLRELDVVQIPSLPVTSYETLGKFLIPSMSSLKNGGK